MFAKAYKLKSNNTLKNTEKKHLVQRIQEQFPSAPEDKVKSIVPVKSSAICMKLVLHSGETVGVYVVDGAPMVIELEDGLVPTVCALWKAPELVPMLNIHSPVLGKMQGGAPLYLPGVVIPEGGVGFPRFSKGAIIAAHTQDNSAAGVVGRALMSSGDMLMRAAGTCMESIQVFGDLLCKDPKCSRIERPKLKPSAYGDGGDQDVNNVADQVAQLNIETVKEEWPSLGKPVSSEAEVGPAVVPNQPRLISEDPPAPPAPPSAPQEEAAVAERTESADEVPADMDALLRWCLLRFLKTNGKNVELPLKTSSLYRNNLIPLCPPNRTLDVKKSSYKKMKKFLEAMQAEGLVEAREVDKGVDALTALNLAHPAVRAHYVDTELHQPVPPPASAEEDYTPPRVREMYCVTAAGAALFPHVKKGTALSPSEVRASVTEYVRARQLQAGGGAVTVDEGLANVTGKAVQDTIKWDALMQTVHSKLTASTELVYSDGTVKLCKARLEPITMQVVTRSGNKKVTLVSNLEAYGFNLSDLSHACQRGVAAACGVTRTPGARGDQLMLQGDQTYFMAKLLIEKYGLPKKYVDGADKALKKKK